MKWNKKFNYPSSTRALYNGRRLYDINNEKLPSVTTILNATKPQEEIDSLNKWRAKVGITQSEIISREATERGASMHAFIEKYLLGKLNLDLLGDNRIERIMADQIIENGLKNRLQEIWGCESTLYYPGKYAGAADCLGIYENYQTCIDFKQSNKPRKHEWNSTYYMQLGAYSLAHNTVYGTHIDQGVILVCTKDNIFQKFVIYGEELKDYQNKFLERVEKYYSQKKN
tara:strand:- start:643 stop:1326 length:684 start_codon:yes stop_codon:yes gene_type:complete